MPRQINVIHPDKREIEVTSGAMTRIAGVSQASCNAQGIHLAIATIPPGCGSSPHKHINCESAIYILKGYGHLLVGEQLEESLSIGPGDLIYIPPEKVHAPINDGKEALELIVARNAPVGVVEEYASKNA